MGADVNIKDIFVEVDCMAGFTSTTQEYFDDVAEEFAKEGHNIQLHIDAGPNFRDHVTGRLWSSYPGGSGASIIPYVNEWDSFDRIEEIANNNFTQNRRMVFHYCAFVENLGGAGGTAYLNHQLFTVLSDMSDWAKGAAFMHELGHNLGLHHGGSDGLNNKPNYLSNMNYVFAYSDDLAYKYSDYDLPDINENSLDETVGIDPKGLTAGTGIHTALVRDGDTHYFMASKTPLDYNNDGDTNDKSVRMDICNRSQATESDATVSYDVLTSQNDWAVLNLKGGNIGEVGDSSKVVFESSVENIEPYEPTNDDLREAGMFPARAEPDGDYSKVISISLDNIYLNYNSSTTITPTVEVDGDVDYTVTYESSDTSVAAVDENGRVTTNGTGSAEITVTVTDEYGNTVTDTCEVNVSYAWWQWIIVIVLFGWIWY